MPLTLSPTQIAFNARGDGTFHRPFAEQVEFLRKKLNLPTAHWDDILKSAHDRGFIVAGALKADLIKDFHDAIVQTAAEGKSIQWFKREFETIVARHGWSGFTGDGTKAGRDWRARVIYRTNLSASYAAGRWAQLHNPSLLKLRPYWKYVHSDTVQHPRPLHLAWGNKPVVLRHDDPWWQTHFPPLGFGCRCRVTAVGADEYPGDPAPDDGTWTKVDRHGEAHEIPKGIDYGWDYAPGANVTQSFQSLIDDKLIRLPAPIGAAMWQTLKPILAMERQLQWWKTLDEWLATPQSGRVAVVGTLTPDILAWLNDRQSITPQSAEIAIREGLIRGTKQARHEKAGDGLTHTEWRMLTAIVGDPEQVLFDTQTGKLLYIAMSTDAGIKLAVEYDYAKKGMPVTNMIVSGFRQSAATIAEKIRGGIYVIVE